MQQSIPSVSVDVTLSYDTQMRFTYSGGSETTPVAAHGDIDLTGVAGPVRLVFNLRTRSLDIGGETVFLCFAQHDGLCIAREPNKPAGIRIEGEFVDFLNGSAGSEPLRSVTVVDRKLTAFNYKYTLRVVGVSQSTAQCYEDDPVVIHDPN